MSKLFKLKVTWNSKHVNQAWVQFKGQVDKTNVHVGKLKFVIKPENKSWVQMNFQFTSHMIGKYSMHKNQVYNQHRH